MGKLTEVHHRQQKTMSEIPFQGQIECLLFIKCDKQYDALFSPITIKT